MQHSIERPEEDSFNLKRQPQQLSNLEETRLKQKSEKPSMQLL
jgi:hypothetical protein